MSRHWRDLRHRSGSDAAREIDIAADCRPARCANIAVGVAQLLSLSRARRRSRRTIRPIGVRSPQIAAQAAAGARRRRSRGARSKFRATIRKRCAIARCWNSCIRAGCASRNFASRALARSRLQRRSDPRHRQRHQDAHRAGRRRKHVTALAALTRAGISPDDGDPLVHGRGGQTADAEWRAGCA